MNDSSSWLSDFYFRVMAGLTRKYKAFTISLKTSPLTHFCEYSVKSDTEKHVQFLKIYWQTFDAFLVNFKVN